MFRWKITRLAIEDCDLDWSVQPDQVAERIAEFEAVGVDLLLLQCSPQFEEMERFGEQVIRKN